MARLPHHTATYLHCWSTLGEASPGANCWPCFVAAGAKWFGEQRQATKLFIALEQGGQAWDVGPQDDVLVRICEACKCRCRECKWADSMFQRSRGGICLYSKRCIVGCYFKCRNLRHGIPTQHIHNLLVAASVARLASAKQQQQTAMLCKALASLQNPAKPHSNLSAPIHVWSVRCCHKHQSYANS